MELEYLYLDDSTIRYAIFAIAVCVVVKIIMTSNIKKK